LSTNPNASVSEPPFTPVFVNYIDILTANYRNSKRSPFRSPKFITTYEKTILKPFIDCVMTCPKTSKLMPRCFPIFKLLIQRALIFIDCGQNYLTIRARARTRARARLAVAGDLLGECNKFRYPNPHRNIKRRIIQRDHCTAGGTKSHDFSFSECGYRSGIYD